MSNGDYIRTEFRKRFTPADAGFLYRRSPCEPGFLIAAAERAAMEADLDVQIRRVGWLASGWILFVAAVGVPLLLRYAGVPSLLQFVGFVCVLGVAGRLQLNLEDVARERLARREPAEPRLSRMQCLMRNVADESWIRLIVTLCGAIASLENLGRVHDDVPTLIVFAILGCAAAILSIVDIGAKAWLTWSHFRRA